MKIVLIPLLTLCLLLAGCTRDSADSEGASEPAPQPVPVQVVADLAADRTNDAGPSPAP